MKLDTNEDILQEVREITEFEGRDLRKWLYREILLNALKTKRDELDILDLKVISRTMDEFRYAARVFKPYRKIRKVSIFGSARVPEGEPHYQMATDFGRLMTEQGFMAITGAASGIMKAGIDGAGEENSFGVNIILPFESPTTVMQDDPKSISFHFFFTRKLFFVMEADACVLFPGGFGTQDEGFEAITLVQTGKTSPVPIVMCDEPGGTYWQHWQTYVKAELLGNAMIDPEDTGLFYVTDRAEDAVEHIVRFYRCYHSSRWVGDDFVMRLMHPLSPALLAEINRDFADILTSGGYEQHDGPIDGEDGAHPQKPRLVCRFNRRSVGRLRQLIDRVNEGG